MDFANLSIAELKSDLKNLGVKYAEDSKELIYHLRKKLKAQGKCGEGFGDWVENNLDITRRTADRWADAYAVSIGEKSTSRQNVQKFFPGPGRADDNLYQVELEFDNREELRAFHQAAAILQHEKRLTQVIKHAVLNAAAKVKKPNDIAHKKGPSSATEPHRAAAHA